MQRFWESLTFDEYVALSMADPVLHANLPLQVAHRIEAMFTRWRDLELRRIARLPLPTPRRLSVVMPARNRAHTIHRPIISLRQQVGCEIELVLVDDASTDGTAQRARDLASGFELKVISLPERHGQSAARNIGIEAASSPLVGFLDADDWWDSAFAVIMTNALHEEDAIPVCAQRLLRPWPHRTAFRYGLVAPELLRNRNSISVSTFIAPRSSLLEAGGFPEDLTMYEDWVLASRLSRAFEFHAVPAALSVYDTTTAGSVSKAETVAADRAALKRARARVAEGFTEGTRHPARHPAQSERRRRGEFRTEGDSERPTRGRPCTVVVISHEQPKVLGACLAALGPDAQNPGVDLLIVDNASKDPLVHELLDGFEVSTDATVIRLATNGGFSAAVNRANSHVPAAHDLVVMNNDVIVERGWLEALRDAAADPTVGLAVPTQLVPPDYSDLRTHVPSAESDHPVDVTFSNHSRNVIAADTRRSSDAELRFVPLFCALIPAEVRPLGLPLRGGLHYESDRFLCDVLRLWGGYRLVRATDSRVLHLTDRAGRAKRDDDPSFFRRLLDGTLADRPTARLLQRRADTRNPNA